MEIEDGVMEKRGSEEIAELKDGGTITQKDSSSSSIMKIHQPQSPAACNHNNIQIKIVSATYGPCEGLRLPTGELTNDKAISVPLSRDVTQFLRALLIVEQQRQHYPSPSDGTASRLQSRNNESLYYLKDADGTEAFKHPNMMKSSSTPVPTPTLSDARATKPLWIHVLGGENKPSMNAIFGDPCPGTSKKLYVHYIVTECHPGDTIKMKASKTEVHHVKFAEHDPVVFRRRLTFFQEHDDQNTNLNAIGVRLNSSDHPKMEEENISMKVDPDEKDSNNVDHETRKTLEEARRMGRSQSIAEIVALQQQHPPRTSQPNNTITTSTIIGRRWRLRSAVSEIVLPFVLPFLEVHQRVQCRLICRTWQHVVRDWGVATVIDSNDTSISNFSRPFLRGILVHSYTSLTSLFLSGFESLQKQDIHPAFPHLRNLRSFDVSRCHNLDDSTMLLLSQHVHRTLEVLYIKGLRQVSDVGVKAVCNACKKVEVLEISYVPITDDGGVAIAQLVKLRALFMRDNYHLTNLSIDVITKSCALLAQLTLWGCTKMQHLRVLDDYPTPAISSGKLVILNLWGCYGLKDDGLAEALVNMKNLSSLIVSECHRLTDRFVENLASSVPNLNHLHLRYCKRLTDGAIIVIAKALRYLNTLDLSFCTRVTATSLSNLLETSHDCLSELRLKSCRNLVIVQHDDVNRRDRTYQLGSTAAGAANRSDESDGQIILKAIQKRPSHCLCVLDLRDCAGQPRNSAQGYPDEDNFVIGMKELHFTQRVPGFFSRPSRWSEAQEQLVRRKQS